MTKAFTKTELVIVIVIIAVLALIAVPNMFEARTKGRVSRVISDMRSLATAVEAYKADHGVLPSAVPMVDYVPRKKLTKFQKFAGDRLTTFPPELTTPVAYISSMPYDVLLPGEFIGLPIVYYVDGDNHIMISAGMDADFDIPNPAAVYNGALTRDENAIALAPFTYDPTNGTKSSGDVWRIRLVPSPQSSAP